MDKVKKREVKRIRQMLSEIVSLAEDEELEGGLPNAVKRYNSIVRHLEGQEVLPAGLFQLLNEESGAVNFHQVGVECRMLSGYLEEVIDEAEEENGKPDFSPVIALAPFLDQGDLKTLIQSHLSGRGFSQPARPSGDERNGPGLETLVAMAPHLSKSDLAQMVEACLSRNPTIDGNVLTALAPHLDRNDLGRILRKYAPAWFGTAPTETATQESAARPNSDTDWRAGASRPESELR